MVDTGASISIINSKYASFVRSSVEIDTINIQYGGSMRKCAVYKMILIIKGHEIVTHVAYDPTCPYLLLGHFDFLENMSFSLFDSTAKRTQLSKN